MAIDKIVAEYRLELDGLRQDVNNLKGQLKSVDDSVKQSTDKTTQQMNTLGDQVNTRLSGAFTRLGGVIAAAFATEKIAEFISSSVELATKAEGIKRAFDALNNPNLLAELRAATKGTVSDLQLMQTAVKASNFKLPLDQLARYLKFAQQRAIETGESIDYLVESIVLGISRKSIPILDNLGISAQQVQDEFQRTGDFAQAVGNIIDESMSNAADATLTLAERQAQLRASIDNLKVQIGTDLMPVMEGLLTTINNTIHATKMLFNPTETRKNDILENIINSGMSLEQLNVQLNKNREEIDFLLDRYGNLNNMSMITRAFASEAVKDAKDRYESLVLQNQVIEDYVKGASQATNATQSLEQEQNKMGKTVEETTPKVWALGQALLTLAKHALDASDAMGGSGEQSGSARAAFGVARTEAEKLREELVKLGTQFKDGLPSDTKEGLNSSLEDWDMYTGALLSLFDSFNQAYSNSADYRLSVLERELQSGIVTQETYDQKKRQILREEAQREKAFSLLSISLSTARAVMSALGTVPPNPALAIIAGVTGAAQLAVAASAQIPAFEKGGLVRGGEQIIRINERGEEYVVNARATSKHKDALEAINKDRFDDYVMKIYAKQIKDKQKDTAIGWDEYFYRQYLLQNKLISATEKQGDKVIEAVREMPKRHRFQ